MMTEEELWKSYAGSLFGAGRNEIFEFYWPWAKSEAKIRIHARRADAHCDEILSSLSLEMLSNIIPRFPPQTDGNHFRSLVTGKTSWTISEFLREQRTIGVTRSMRKANSIIAKVRGNLAHQLGRNPTDAEVAEWAGVPEREIVMTESACKRAHEQLTSIAAKAARETSDFEDAIESAPPQYKPILRLRYIQNMGIMEIANAVGLKKSRVSSILARALDFIPPCGK